MYWPHRMAVILRRGGRRGETRRALSQRASTTEHDRYNVLLLATLADWHLGDSDTKRHARSRRRLPGRQTAGRLHGSFATHAWFDEALWKEHTVFMHSIVILSLPRPPLSPRLPSFLVLPACSGRAHLRSHASHQKPRKATHSTLNPIVAMQAAAMLPMLTCVSVCVLRMSTSSPWTARVALHRWCLRRPCVGATPEASFFSSFLLFLSPFFFFFPVFFFFFSPSLTNAAQPGPA